MRMWAWLWFGFDIKTVSPLAAAEKITIPMLFIYSKSDNLITYKHALAMQEALKNNPQAHFIMIDDLTHGHSRQEDQVIIKKFFALYL